MPNPANLVFIYSLCSPEGTSGFTRTVNYWDKGARQQYQETEATFACQANTVADGTVLDVWCDADQTKHTITWNLPGFAVAEALELNSTTCPVPGSLRLLTPQLTYPSGSGTPDGLIVIPYEGADPAGVIAVLSSGATASSAGSIGELRFLNMLAGIYDLDAEDGAGQQAHLDRINLTDAPPPAGEPYWLQFSSDVIPENPPEPAFYIKTGTAWDFARRIVITPAPLSSSGAPFVPDAFSRDVNQIIDSYFLPDGVTFRQVRHDGAGGVRFTYTVPGNGPGAGIALQLDNAIITHVTTPDHATGSVLLEGRSATPGPITYTRLDTNATNTHGRFAGLPVGLTRFRISDAGGQSLETGIQIEDRYRLRWLLATLDSRNQSITVEIYARDFAGEMEEVRGTDNPVVRRWDGAGAADGTLPEASGQQLTLNLRSAYAQQFLPCQLGDDRSHLVVCRRGGVEVFRGYMLPDFYEEDLSRADGGVVTLSAADGLGVLRDTSFLSHIDLPLAGRWPLLHTLLHCLSRCSLGEYPLYVQTGLLDVDMPDTGDALALAYSERSVYREGGEDGREWTCRQVVEAILKNFYAVLFQRDGAWWIVGANAAATATSFFAYSANATALPAKAAPAVHYLKPPGYTTGDVHWRKRAQRLGVLAAARAVVATTQLQLIANQLTDGLLQTWTPLADRPLGWEGNLLVTRLPHETKAGLTRLRLNAAQPLTGEPHLRSPAIGFANGADEAPVLVRLRVRVPAKLDGTEQHAVVRVQGLVGGQPQPAGLHWEVGSTEKEVTVEGFLPFNTSAAGSALQLDLLPAIDADAPAQTVAVDIYEVVLRIQPGGLEWPASDEVTGLNQAGFYVLPQVELTHADAPRLPLANGTLLPAVGMDAQAWRHILTRADGRATTAWRRLSESVEAAPLLETATLDRLNLRRTPVLVLTGPVAGRDAGRLGMGSLVEVSYDAPAARFWVVGCEVQEASGEATLVLRQIGAAATEPLPANRRVTRGRNPRATHDGFTRAWK